MAARIPATYPIDHAAKKVCFLSGWGPRRSNFNGYGPLSSGEDNGRALCRLGSAERSTSRGSATGCLAVIRGSEVRHFYAMRPEISRARTVTLASGDLTTEPTILYLLVGLFQLVPVMRNGASPVRGRGRLLRHSTKPGRGAFQLDASRSGRFGTIGTRSHGRRSEPSADLPDFAPCIWGHMKQGKSRTE